MYELAGWFLEIVRSSTGSSEGRYLSANSDGESLFVSLTMAGLGPVGGAEVPVLWEEELEVAIVNQSSVECVVKIRRNILRRFDGKLMIETSTRTDGRVAAEWRAVNKCTT